MLATLVIAVVTTSAPGWASAHDEVAAVESSGPTHFAATFTGALVGAIPGAALAGLAVHLGSSPWAPVAGTAGLLLLPIGIGFGATMAHALSGGEGGLATALLAGAISVGAAAGALAVFTFAGDASDRRKPQFWGPAAAVALLLPIATVSVALEVDHRRAIHVGATPLAGGAALSVSGAL